uniref:Peptidase_M1_N domain-containing protein n=1 Tax=Heterorhabditis bacteriophora TaxID=37862 RepID=A0A1I7XGK3_HETBA
MMILEEEYLRRATLRKRTWQPMKCFSSLYALILYVSLVNKIILHVEDGPQSIPYINVPTRYDITLQFETEYNKSSKVYSGTVSMVFEARELSQHIYVHKGNTTYITNYALFANNKKLSIRKGKYCKQTEIQTFISSNNLTTDTEYRLEIKFTGEFLPVIGLTEFTYISEDGKMRYGIRFMSKQTARKGLRYLFPCLDSNDYPAFFHFKVKRKLSLRVLGNYYVTHSTQSSLIYMTDTLPSQSILRPIQVGLVLCEFQYKTETYDGLVVINAFPSYVPCIFNHKKYTADAIIIPDTYTLHQPGISILNEEEILVESREFTNFNISM